MDNIGLPISGINMTYNNTGVVGAQDGDVIVIPERLQTVLGLHYLEGLTYREIAKILDVSEPRVCQLHGDGLRKLKAALANETDER